MSIKAAVRNVISPALSSPLNALVYSPNALYLNGERGVWFDPSDLGTMYQNIGTSIGPSIPVTAAGQPVGAILDKSRSLARGNELVTNGDFSAGSANWTQTSATLTVVNGVGRHVGLAANGANQNTITLDTTKLYELVFDVVENTDTVTTTVSVREFATTTQNTATPISAGQTGTFRSVFRPTSSSSRIHIRSSATSTGYVGFDNVSVREIQGFHAEQLSAASRPLLGRHPVTGVRNMVAYSEDFTIGTGGRWSSLAGGTGIAPVVTANHAVAPDNTQTADLVVLNKGAGTTNTDQCSIFASSNTIGTVAGQPYTAFVWMKTSDGSTKNVRMDFNGTEPDSGTSGLKTVTGVWQKFEIKLASAADTTRSLAIRLRGGLGTSDTASLHVWGAQQELGLTATAYQKTETLLDVTEAGVRDAYYLKFDGIDDSMSVTALNMSASDKISVFVGARKLTDATGTAQVLAEFGDTTTGVGTFAVFAPLTSTAPRYDFRSRGTVQANVSSASLFPAPNTSVLTCIGDISGDVCRLRVNGHTSDGSSLTDQGTGSYGTFNLFFGRRGGTSLPFNGHLYAFILRGALTSHFNIFNTERYIASKTGASTL